MLMWSAIEKGPLGRHRGPTGVSYWDIIVILCLKNFFYVINLLISADRLGYFLVLVLFFTL